MKLKNKPKRDGLIALPSAVDGLTVLMMAVRGSEVTIMKIWKDDENHTFVQVTTVDKIIAVCGIILFVIALLF